MSRGWNAKKIYTHLMAYRLLYLGLLIHCMFYLSVSKTGWLDIFFSGAALHDGAKGIDFYQIPRGAWAFWHGGQLTGSPLAEGSMYAKTYFANSNVYHPLFTILLGSLLMQFAPAQAPYVWLWIKLAVSLAVFAYFYWSFRSNTYIQFAVFILLTNFSTYLELAAWQFQFVLNIFLLLLLMNLVRRKPAVLSGLYYWYGLLVKPIGLLFLPALLCKRRYVVALIGVVLFALELWLLSGMGKYYSDNLVANILHPDNFGPNQIITLNALLHFSALTHWPDAVYKVIQYGTLLLVVGWGALKRVHISKAIFLAVAYYLCFYSLVYEYQWSSLAYVLAICVVCCPAFQTRLSRCCILLTCLPSCFVLLQLWHIDIQNEGIFGLIPGEHAWELMVVSKIVPLALLCISVCAGDVRPIYQQARTLLSAVRKGNRSVGVAGETKEEAHV